MPIGGHLCHAGASSLRMRAELYAAAAKVQARATSAMPLNQILRWPAIVLIQPNAPSIRYRPLISCKCNCENGAN